MLQQYTSFALIVPLFCRAGGRLCETHLPPHSVTTSAQRKRKASDIEFDSSLSQTSKSRKIKSSQLQTPSTPVSERRSPSPGTMDSEDEIMSGSQSADELDLDEGTQDSDLGSIAGGESGTWCISGK